MLNPRYRNLGLVALPYFTFVELLAPIVEAVGLLGLAVGLDLGALTSPSPALFFLVAYGLGLVMTVMLALEWNYRAYGGPDESLRLLGFAPLEPLGSAHGHLATARHQQPRWP